MAQDLQVSSIEWPHAGQWSGMTGQEGFGAQWAMLYVQTWTTSALVKSSKLGSFPFLSSFTPIDQRETC